MSAPVLFTTRAHIREVAARWRVQYPSNTLLFGGAHSGDIYKRLLALDPEAATEEDVAAIIGNSGWTRIDCDGCEKSVKAAVQVGAPPDYDSATALLCAECIRVASALLDGEG